MNKKFLLAPILLLVVAAAGCYTTVGPGYAGIVVHQTGSQRGVSDFPVKTGRVFYNPINTDVIEYPTFIQTAMWTKNPNEGHPSDESITFTTKDSMVVHADISLSYHQLTEKVPAFYLKFHIDDIDSYTYGFLHNIARDKMNEIGGQYTVEQIMGDNGPFLEAVRKAIQDEVSPYGTVIDQFGFIGAPSPPQTVMDSINSKVQAQQIALQKQNEVQQATFDAQKRVAQATGEAQANALLAKSISPELIEWRKLDLENQALSRWDGKQPTTLMTGGGNGSGILLQMPVVH